MDKSGKLDKGDDLQYMQGFGNHFVTEALKDALPKNQNNPQKCNYGLYGEQLSGTPFTFQRSKNQYSWLYRIMPSAVHEAYKPLGEASNTGEDNQMMEQFISNFADSSDKRLHITPERLRWKPMKYPSAEETKVNFIQGIKTMCGAGDPAMKDGLGIHGYTCNTSMHKTSFYSADGDMLIVPQEGTLYVTTEFGRLTVGPLEICVIQRGMKFRVDLGGFWDEDEPQSDIQSKARGFICETFKGHFVLPDLGPIGANSLANPMHFQTPVAWFEDKTDSEWTVTCKFSGNFFQYKQDHSPFDVVAWHGNYAPYKYDLRLYNTIGSISYDHPDPSIFTVLTCASDDPGQAVVDFVIFPPRWLVAEHTFRPPYYHRNTMSEFMGNLAGVYDAKEYGFIPGAMSLHSAMSGHGPEQAVYEKASDNSKPQQPQFVGKDSMAFMFETCYMMKITDYAANSESQDTTYVKDSYSKMIRHFDKMKISNQNGEEQNQPKEQQPETDQVAQDDASKNNEPEQIDSSK